MDMFPRTHEMAVDMFPQTKGGHSAIKTYFLSSHAMLRLWLDLLGSKTTEEAKCSTRAKIAQEGKQSAD